MGKKGLHKESQKKKEQKPLFNNVAPAGRASKDPAEDVAMGLFLVAVGGVCHLWSKTQLTKVLFIMMCVVAVYLVGRGVMAFIKNGKGEKK